MAAKVQFKITKESKFSCPEEAYSPETALLFKPGYQTGQIIFVEDLGQIYLDFHNYRKCYTPTTDYVPGINYLGISTTDPATGTVTVDGEVVTPNEKDLVVFGTKEYMYRKGEDGVLGWFEVGDEDNPAWQDNEMEWGDDTEDEDSSASNLIGG
jgi:hypothetical protein